MQVVIYQSGEWLQCPDSGTCRMQANMTGGLEFCCKVIFDARHHHTMLVIPSLWIFDLLGYSMSISRFISCIATKWHTLCTFS